MTRFSDLVPGPCVHDYQQSLNDHYHFIVYLFAVALRPNAGHGLLIHEVSRSHTTTHHSGRVIIPNAETSTWQHSQQTCMPQVLFEPVTPAGERQQTHALDRAANGTGT